MCPSDPSNPPAPTELRVANMSFGPGSTVGARIEWSMPPDLDVPIHHYKVSWSWTAVGHSSASSLTKRRKTVRKVRMPQLQMEHVSLRPKKDIMYVMFSETLVEWSVCSMFTSVITTGSKYDLNITWNQWCGVCLIVCLCVSVCKEPGGAGQHEDQQELQCGGSGCVLLGTNSVQRTARCPPLHHAAKYGNTHTTPRLFQLELEILSWRKENVFMSA